jgi:hypothetical protein
LTDNVYKLIARCRVAGLDLLAEGTALHVEFEREPPADLIEQIRRHKPEVIAALSGVSAAGSESRLAPPSLPVESEVAPERAAAVGLSEHTHSHDQPCASRRGLVERRDDLFLHFCAVCGRWGAFGYGPPGFPVQTAEQWYCGEHRPD